jgi:hypothetical protein
LNGAGRKCLEGESGKLHVIRQQKRPANVPSAFSPILIFPKSHGLAHDVNSDEAANKVFFRDRSTPIAGA